MLLLMKKECPKCSSDKRFRIKRSSPLKLIPFLKLYYCSDCSSKYVWSPLLPFTITAPKKSVPSYYD